MKYPDLVPKWATKTPISITLYGDGVDEDGAPIVAFRGDLMCNWQESSGVARTTQTRTLRIAGVALFSGDIAPELPVISSGKVEVLGGRYAILRGSKARNPDGTVNYTRLEVG